LDDLAGRVAEAIEEKANKTNAASINERDFRVIFSTSDFQSMWNYILPCALSRLPQGLA
jgi:hypothetical protein